MISVARCLPLSRLPRLVGVALILLTAGRTATAFNLGQIAVRSHAGEALDASVTLYIAPRERADDMQVSIDEDLFAPRSLAQHALLAQLDARVVHHTDSHSELRIRSRAPLALTQFSFRLRVASGSVALTRNYAIALRAAPAPRRLARGTQRMRNVTRAQALANPRVEVTAGAIRIDPASDTYTVRSGDSLWAIARRIASGANIEATMRALHAANPAAFIAGDSDRLKAGAVLRLPDAITEMASAAPTRRETDQPRGIPQQTTSVDATPARASTAAVPQKPPTQDRFDVLTQLDAHEEAPAAPTSAVVPATTSGASVVRDLALAQRLAALDVKYAAIWARYGGTAATAGEPPRSAPSTGIGTDTAVVTSDIVVTPPSAKPTPAPRKPEKVSPPSKPPRQAAPAATTTETADVVETSLLAAVGTVLLLFTTLWIRVRQRQVRRRAQLTAHLAREAEQRAAVAEKAGRGVVGLEVRDRDRLPVPAVSELEGFEFSTTLENLDEAGVNTGPDLFAQTRVEIDASIAHGRYQDAERLLLKVVAMTPRNAQARLRLAEVYFITERVQEFVALAEVLHQHHRADLSGDEWRRVMRMGKIIAPEMPLFAGPRAVSNG
jgi:pilus assembly protein FimV